MVRHTMVPELPDLIFPEEYEDHPDGRLVRMRITVRPDGVELLGDAFRPQFLESLLAELGPDEIEQMLCG
ncbi:MAG: hypothetical protein HOW97_31795 [Catenulispora sp.]|nr:hypothetical protein [Catenulispora sp.]